MINNHFTAQLAKAGFKFEIAGPTLFGGVEIAAIVVKDPVQCSSGQARWTESRDVRMTNNAQVMRFISERS